jgi:hypothetical protein
VSTHDGKKEVHRMRGLCQVCHHSQRSVIDAHLSAGRDLRSLADAYGLDTRALRTHRDEHVRSTSVAKGRRGAARAGR